MADLWIAVVSSEAIINHPDGSGDVYKNFKSVIREILFTNSYATFNDCKTAIEQNANTKVYQLTEEQYDDLVGDLHLDAYTNLPKWQIDDSTEEIGSYTDPEDTETDWNVGVPISDHRYRLKIRHNASFTNGENTAPTISDSTPNKITLEQYDKTSDEPDDRVVVGMELFNKNGAKLDSFQGKNVLFYNGSTPTIVDFTDGFAHVFIRTDRPTKKQKFGSNCMYRIEQGDRQISFVIYSRTLND